MSEWKFKRDTSFSLMRIKFMISIILVLFYEAIVLTPITFLAGCYQIIKHGFAALRCGDYMVSFQDCPVLNSPPAVLTSEVISTQDRKSNSQSSLLKVVISLGTFKRTIYLPPTPCYKWLGALQASIWSLISGFLFPVLHTPMSVIAFVRTIEGTATSGKIITANDTPDNSFPVIFPIHTTIIAECAGVCKWN